MSDNGKATADELVRVFEHIGDEANTDMVFGESRVMGDHVIIPVARVRYGGGAGAGGGERERDPEAEHAAVASEGVGGGFGVSAVPMGAIDVTNDRVAWSPLVDWGRLATIWSVVSGMALLMVLARNLFRRRAPIAG